MVEVIAGVIMKDNKILITKRPVGDKREGLWEFPGGKIERGESPEDCLAREIKEELDISIEVKEHLMDSEYKYDDIHINLRAYRAKYLYGDIKLNAHDEYRWAAIGELMDYSFAPADIPIVRKLEKSKFQP